MKKEVILGVFLLLFLLPLISAVPPFQQSVADKGLEIKYPQYDLIPKNTGFTLYTHIFNKSDGLLVTNETTSCIIHLYAPNGSHILEETMGWEDGGIEFKLDIDKSNFSELGTHAYIIQCNTTTEGGFVSGLFDVSETGKNLTIENSIIYFALLIGVFLLFIMALIGTFLLPLENKKDQLGNITGVSAAKYFKVGLIGISYALFTWVLNLLLAISNNYSLLTQYTQFFSMLFKIITAIAYPFIIIIFIVIFTMAWKDFGLIKLLERGLPDR